jgi:hypothetical protein
MTTPEFANYPGDWHLSPVLDTGEFVFFSGITGTHPNLSVATDPTAQFRDTFKFLLANLRVAGLGFEHVVDMTSYPRTSTSSDCVHQSQGWVHTGTISSLDGDWGYWADHRGNARRNPSRRQKNLIWLSIDTTSTAVLAFGRMSATIGTTVMHPVSRARNNKEMSDAMKSVHLCSWRNHQSLLCCLG